MIFIFYLTGVSVRLYILSLNFYMDGEQCIYHISTCLCKKILVAYIRGGSSVCVCVCVFLFVFGCLVFLSTCSYIFLSVSVCLSQNVCVRVM